MQGNGEAYNAKHTFDIANEMRNERVTMNVYKPANSVDDYYIGFLTIPDFETRKQLFQEGDKSLVTWDEAPEVLPPEERGEGVKAPQDKPFGWRAIVMPEDFVYAEADLMILLERRTNPENTYVARGMPSSDSLDKFPEVEVMLKVYPSAYTVKTRLNALFKHSKSQRPEEELDLKRNLLAGQSVSTKIQAAFFDKLSSERLEEIKSTLNDSQAD